MTEGKEIIKDKEKAEQRARRLELKLEKAQN